MKPVKLSVIALASVLLAGSLIAAPQNADQKSDQKAPRRGAPVQQRMEALDKELKLTEPQKSKLQALFKEEGEKLREFRQQNASATREQRQERMKTFRENHQKKMKEILTSDQYEKWQKMPAQTRGPRAGTGRGDRTPEKKSE